MEESGGGEVRSWDELIPDALGLIFRNLTLQETLTVVPRVCKAWGRAVAGPYCWQEIDIDEWSQRCTKPELLERMLRMLVACSAGSFHRLSVSGLPNDSVLSFIADHAGSLKTLELPRSEISDSIVEQVAGKLTHITFLDVSYCKKIGPRALEAIGRHCKSLVGLRRTMNPLEVADKVCQDDEAYAIACTMPKLHHLELSYLLLTTCAIIEILSRCRDLKYLDIRGCWEVKVDETLRKGMPSGLKILGPHIVECYDWNLWSDCSDYSYSDSSDYSWEFMEDDVGVYEETSDDDVVWDDDQGLEGLEVRFYGGGYNGAFAGFDWPPSP